MDAGPWIHLHSEGSSDDLLFSPFASTQALGSQLCHMEGPEAGMAYKGLEAGLQDTLAMGKY